MLNSNNINKAHKFQQSFYRRKNKTKKKNTSKKQVELGDFLTFAVLSAYIVLAEYIKSFLAFSIT